MIRLPSYNEHESYDIIPFGILTTDLNFMQHKHPTSSKLFNIYENEKALTFKMLFCAYILIALTHIF